MEKGNNEIFMQSSQASQILSLSGSRWPALGKLLRRATTSVNWRFGSTLLGKKKGVA